ncbi:MAG: glycosyltransferase [Rivularia sp. (in: Bacteria)]|nr:glycosyltransferase [Rivularia sp. MS3]
MIKPWKILHINLNNPLPNFSEDFYDINIAGYSCFFWLDNIALGNHNISINELPIPTERLKSIVAMSITNTVGDKLLNSGFKPFLSEHFIRHLKNQVPDIKEIQKINSPLSKLNHINSQSQNDEIEQLTVSVIICTRNRPEQLKNCIKSLEKLSTLPDQIIVVDNQDQNDETFDIVKKSPLKIEYVREPRAGLSIARNTGIKQSVCDLIAFTDDDVETHPDWIFRLKKSFKSPQIMAVTGLMLPLELETESQLIFEQGHGNFSWGFRSRLFDSNFFEQTRRVGVPAWRIGAGANMIFRREIFSKVGNFNEGLGAGASGCSEDSEFWYRILADGWHCYYDPSVVVFHRHRSDIKSLNSQMYQYMRGHITALLVQFEQHWHWGNLYRILISIPKYYLALVIKAIIWRKFPTYKTYLAEVRGCMAGIGYYFINHKQFSNFINNNTETL